MTESLSLSDREPGRRRYEQAIHDYAVNRGYKIREVRYVEGSNRDVGVADMEKNHALLEELSPEDHELQGSEPICTVCMPVAILEEDIQKVCRSVELVGSSQLPENEQLELVIWANAAYSGYYDEETVRREAAEKYETLRRGLDRLDTPRLKIKTALQMFSRRAFSMSQMRRNYMDAVTLDALEGGYDFDHPVVWLDADTTQLSPRSLYDLSGALRGHEALFVHADLQYNLDWVNGPLSEQDDATRAVALSEIHRRQAEREMSDDNSLGYIEECGLAFSVGTYLEAGGVRTDSPVNESIAMINRADRVLKPASLIKFIRSARVGTSARRHYDRARADGIAGLKHVTMSGYGKTTFGHMSVSQQGKPRAISAEEMQNLFEENDAEYAREIQESPSFNPDRRANSQKVAGHLIRRYFQ